MRKSKKSEREAIPAILGGLGELEGSWQVELLLGGHSAVDGVNELRSDRAATNMNLTILELAWNLVASGAFDHHGLIFHKFPCRSGARSAL